MEKESAGETTIEVSMSYYEIYNDRVFDLFEAPEKRTPSGLPIRDNNGKTVVVGLSERPCTTLKEFEQLYDHANINRSTSATKASGNASQTLSMTDHIKAQRALIEIACHPLRQTHTDHRRERAHQHRICHRSRRLRR